MANLIKIVLEGSDQTGPAFLSAARNAKTFSADLKVTGAAFGQLGNIASTVGATNLAGLIGTFESASISAASLTKELSKSKLAIAALGTAVAAGGFQVGKSIGEQLFGGAGLLRAAELNDQLTSIKRQIADVRGESSLSKELARIDEELGKLEARTMPEGANFSGLVGPGAAMLGPLRDLMRGKDMLKPAEVQPLTDAYNDLRTAIIKTGEAQAQAEAAEGFEAAKAKWEELIQVKYAAQNATLGLMQAEKIRHDKELERIGELATTALLTEQETNSLIEAERQAHSARLLQIETDRVKKERQLALNNAGSVLSQAGNLFGSLAALSAAYGKKNFGLTQAFRYAEAVVNTAAAVTRALAAFDPPLNFVMAALTAAAGAAQIATIAAAKPTGQAHGGLTEVGSAGSYNLIQGERILAPRQNADLTEFLENRSSGGNSTVMVYLDRTLIAREIGRMSRDGLLEIDARSIQ